MNVVKLAAVAVISLMGVDAALAARTAEQTAYRSARRHGYSEAQTRCFVPIFVQYAYLDRRGRWVAGSRTKKRGDVYRSEVYSRCGVTR
jgi:hypothetical protein